MLSLGRRVAAYSAKHLYRVLPLAREANMPAEQRAVKIMKAILVLIKNDE